MLPGRWGIEVSPIDYTLQRDVEVVDKVHDFVGDVELILRSVSEAVEVIPQHFLVAPGKLRYGASYSLQHGI